MSDIIEGRRAIEEALRAGVPIRRVLVAESASGAAATYETSQAAKGQGRSRHKKADSDPALNRLIDKLRKSGIEVTPVPRSELDRISVSSGSHGAHQGIVCEVPDYRYADLAAVAASGAAKDSALILVLDHITDEGNLGAIIRTAEVVGAEGVVIPAKRAAQVTSGVYKTSAGAALHIPIVRVGNVVGALESLKRAGFWVAGASERAQVDIWHAPLSGRICLVMGSEGDGISRLVSEACDFHVALPQRGRVGSLNVAQATTAIAYEWMRRSVGSGEGEAR